MDIARISISIFGMFLIVEAIREQAASSYSISHEASSADVLLIFMPSIALIAIGVLCIALNKHLYKVVFRGLEEGSSHKHQTVERFEAIAYTLIGLYFLFSFLMPLAMTINNLLPLNMEAFATEGIPLESYMWVQLSALFLGIAGSLLLVLFPQKVQKYVKLTRGF